MIAPERPPEFVRNHEVESRRKLKHIPIQYPTLKTGLYQVHSECARMNMHTQDFLFYIDIQIITQNGKAVVQDGKVLVDRTIEKVGQRPSYGDLNLSKVDKYKHVLTKNQLTEFKRAIGLASHDVGIGSYVYLRRIFESLIDDAHQLAMVENAWDEDAYQKLRMNEKIRHLSQYLPEFLVQNPAMYSLLSKGVHELSEKQCLKHFDTLKIGIELILDQKVEELERKRKIDAAN